MERAATPSGATQPVIFALPLCCALVKHMVTDPSANGFPMKTGSYKAADMLNSRQWQALPRPEEDLKGRWGLYAVDQDRWLDAIFPSEGSARDAIAILTKPGPARLGS